MDLFLATHVRCERPLRNDLIRPQEQYRVLWIAEYVGIQRTGTNEPIVVLTIEEFISHFAALEPHTSPSG